MIRQSRCAVAALVLSGAVACTMTPVRVTPGVGAPAIAQLDHIMFIARQPSALIALLADTLHLPLVWPTPENPWSTSSGIAFGNVTLEVMHSAREEPFLSSLALQATSWPSLENDLRTRGVEIRAPASGPIDSTRPSAGPRWTLRPLGGFGRGVFVVQYHHFDMNERRARSARELVRRGGGPLGVLSMCEVLVAAESLDVHAGAWTKLFGAAPAGGLSWPVGEGPRITVVPLDDPRSDALIIAVKSLPSARHVLDSLRIGYEATARMLRVDRSRLGGLRLVLVQPRSDGCVTE
jgi:hypothetical protein